MSSCIDDIDCPNPDCDGTARREQDTDTCEVSIHCPVCGYEGDEDV